MAKIIMIICVTLLTIFLYIYHFYFIKGHVENETETLIWEKNGPFVLVDVFHFGKASAFLIITGKGIQSAMSASGRCKVKGTGETHGKAEHLELVTCATTHHDIWLDGYKFYVPNWEISQNFWQYTMCLSSPLRSGDDVKQFYSDVLDWIDYHFSLGVSHFIIFSLNPRESVEYLHFYHKLGLLHIVDFRKILEHDLWYFGQHVALHYCLFYYRGKARFVGFGDLDEYYVPSETYISLPQLASNYIKDDIVAITLGKILIPRNSTASVHDVDLHDRWIECSNDEPPELCLRIAGVRKYIVDPEKVHQLMVHFPNDYKGEVYDIPTNVARIHHYRNEQSEQASKRASLESEVDLIRIWDEILAWRRILVP